MYIIGWTVSRGITRNFGTVGGREEMLSTGEQGMRMPLGSLSSAPMMPPPCELLTRRPLLLQLGLHGGCHSGAPSKLALGAGALLAHV